MSDSNQGLSEIPGDGPEKSELKTEHDKSKDKVKPPENPASEAELKDEGKSEIATLFEK